MNINDNKTDKICVAKIVGVHGLRGLVKVKIFADDQNMLIETDDLSDKSGKNMFDFLRLSPNKDHYLGELSGIKDRTAAEGIKGVELYMPREALPEIADDDEFYHVDLIDMIVHDENDQVLGKIIAVQNFGAGDLLEIKPPKGASYFVPFTKQSVPKIDLENRIVHAILPDGWLDEEKD